MSNIFKSERPERNDRPERNNRHYLSPSNNQNSFRSNNEKKIPQFILNENTLNNDFPELFVNDQKQDNIKEILNYKTAATKEIVEEEEIKNTEEVLPPGWVSYRRNKNGKIIITGNYAEEEVHEETPEEFNERAYNIVQALVDTWEKRRTDYNDIYGEGEYERDYYMSNYEYMQDEDSD
jgi:hypothetical protein